MNERYSLLSKGKLKLVKKILFDSYGFSAPEDWIFLEKGKDKLWITTKSVVNTVLENLRVEIMGLFFGTLDGNSIRLHAEGAQLVGAGASKNVMSLSEEQALMYIKGYDLDIPNSLEHTYLLLKCSEGFLGAGKNNGKKIFCQGPKERRLKKI